MALTIGQLASRTSIGVETIRFYERQGLIEEPPRKESGYRQYPDQTVNRLRFIRRSKDLGFSLKEISELLSLRVDPKRSCSDVKEQVELKLAEIDAKVRSLRKMKKALRKLAASCTGQGPTSECSILDALEGESNENRTGLRV